jgi:hypothetical protein
VKDKANLVGCNTKKNENQILLFFFMEAKFKMVIAETIKQNDKRFQKTTFKMKAEERKEKKEAHGYGAIGNQATNGAIVKDRMLKVSNGSTWTVQSLRLNPAQQSHLVRAQLGQSSACRTRQKKKDQYQYVKGCFFLPSFTYII